METKLYHKLVRDHIPEIIKANGGIATTRILSADEYSASLKEKLLEEVQEFLYDDSEEELADIFEVLMAIMDEHGISFDELEGVRHRKAEKNGGFKNRIFLVSVTE